MFNKIETKNTRVLCNIPDLGIITFELSEGKKYLTLYDNNSLKQLWNIVIENVQESDSVSMSFIGKILFVIDNYGNTFLIDVETAKIIQSYLSDEIGFGYNPYKINSLNKFEVCSRGGFNNCEYGLYDINERKVIFWTKNNLVGFYPDNNIFIKNNNSIQIFSTEIFQILWQFTLESLHQAYDGFSEKWNKPMEIANFCGVANEVLWMDVVCRGIGNFLLGLDVHTGQPVHLLDKAENRFERYPFDMIPTDGRTTYDDKRNILFGFAPDWVHWQVDLSEKSPKIKMWDLTEEVTLRNAYVSAYMNCGISDSHVFFPVGSLGSTPPVFALNRETLKVDWQYHFTEGGQYFTPTKVEVTETHLYVLDNTGTLHIFEKTENN
jgi:hypothetical protein